MNPEEQLLAEASLLVFTSVLPYPMFREKLRKQGTLFATCEAVKKYTTFKGLKTAYKFCKRTGKVLV